MCDLILNVIQGWGNLHGAWCLSVEDTNDHMLVQIMRIAVYDSWET